MPVQSITSDPHALTVTAIGEYPVPVERLWRAWADPRQLERFWGPPEYPATFTRHDLKPGGESRYHMTGPDGEEFHGMWKLERVDPPTRMSFVDRFLAPDGSIDESQPESHTEVLFEATDTGSRFTVTSRWDSLEAMETLLAMGMLEGLEHGLAQLDAVLAE